MRSPYKFAQSAHGFDIYDLSIGSTKTKSIKLNTKTQFFFIIAFDFCIHFKKENFFSFGFLVQWINQKCIKKSFHLHNKNILGFRI